MGKTWKDVLVPFLGQDYPLPVLVELWSREDTYLNYDKLNQLKAGLVKLDIDVPKEISSRLEISDHKKRRKGEK